MDNYTEKNSNISNNYRNELNNGILWIISVPTLSHAEKILLLTLFSLEGSEYYDAENDLFVVSRETNDKKLASLINVGDRSIRMYMRTLQKEGYVLKLHSPRFPEKSFYVLLFGPEVFSEDSNKRIELIRSNHVKQIFVQHGTTSFNYLFQNANPGIHFVIVGTRINLGRSLAKEFRSKKLHVFGPNTIKELTFRLTESPRRFDNIKRIKKTVDVLIVREMPSDENAFYILLDCIYERYKNNLCTILISDKGKTFDSYMQDTSHNKEASKLIEVIKKHIIQHTYKK